MQEELQDGPETIKGPPHPLKTSSLAVIGFLGIAFFFKEGVLSATAALLAVAIIALLGYFLFVQYRYHQRRLYPSVKRPVSKGRFMTLALIIVEAIVVLLAALFSLPVVPVALLGIVLIALIVFWLRSAFN